MVTGWVLWLVMTNGSAESTLSIFPGFLSETECNQLAAQSETARSRWICFNSNR